MKNELQKRKRADSIKWIFTGIAFVLLFVAVIGLCLQLFGTGKVKPSEWFKTNQEETQTSIDSAGTVFFSLQNDEAGEARAYASTYAASGSLCTHVNSESGFPTSYTITNVLGSVYNTTGNTSFSRCDSSDSLIVKFVNAESNESVIVLENNYWERYKATCTKYVRDTSSLNTNAVKSTTYTAYYIEICCHDFRTQVEEAGIIFQNLDLSSLKFESSKWQKTPTYFYNSEEDYLIYRIYTTASTNPLTNGGYTFTLNVGNIPPDPVKEGYTFTGWYLDEECTVPFTETTVTEDMTLYAGWKINTYTLTLNANGGVLAETTISGEYNSVPTILEPTRTGYLFMGWKTENGKSYNTSSPLTENLTLIAQWQASICTLTLNANGGELAETMVSGEYNSVPTIPEPTRTEHTFLGWKIQGGQDYDISSPLTQDLTLIAQWKLNTYTLTLNANGGEISVNSVTGDYNTVPTIPTPTRTGYTFTGWQTASGEAYNTATPLTQDITLVAQWEINIYTLTLSGNGGELSETSISGEYNSVPTIPEPVRTGYDFTGWQTADGEAYDISAPFMQNLSLVAQWKIKMYKVTFMVDGVVYKEKFVEHGTKLLYVTESTVPELFALYTLDVEGESLSSDYAVDGDITVHAEKGTTAQKVKGNWWKILIGGVVGAAGLALLCSIPSMIKHRKRR